MSNTHYVRAPFTIVNIDIAHDEAWFDPVPQLLDEQGDPVDLTGTTMTLYVRPTYDHSVLIYSLTTGDGIVYNDAANGLFTLALSQGAVEDLPIGEWDQFLVVSQASFPQDLEIWRGKLRIHPGRVTA